MDDKGRPYAGRVFYEQSDLPAKNMARKAGSLVIFVVDASDRDRISCAKDELEALLLHPDFRKRHFSLLLLLNKMDLDSENTMSAVEIETILRLKHLQLSQRNVDLHVQSCSAIKGTGIEEGFRWLGDSMNSSG